MSEAMVVSVKDLRKTFRVGWRGGPIRALDGVSVSVGRGEVFGLLGPNGAGKTTLVKVLLGITHADAGVAEVLGRPAGDVQARCRVGYLPEGHRYPLHLTGEGVVRWFARLSGVPGAEIGGRCAALLERVGLTRWAGVRLRKYSKGMVQRLGLAVALVHRPDLLFLDEPTDGVDPVGRAEIRRILLEEKERGTAIFINSHLLSEIERTCDRVAIVSQGKILRSGTVSELTERGLSYRVDAGTVPAPLMERIRELASSVEATNGSLHLRVGSLEALNACLDSLRGSGNLIRQVTPEKTTLEESFIQILGGEESKP
ncbi:MAG TPA: ABC transporter ATP-binding protein [Candidatus Polarisedimenticolia bacterium]|nr:ABC transporter ATP-binding protein [Candidatus Polarisedimenticolia bacterium]